MQPDTEEALATAVREATAPLRIMGGGTCGALSEGDILSLAGLSGIVLHEPGALTLVAQAGTPVEEIASALAVHNQRLAFEPPDLRGLLGTEGAATIGGVVAVNAAGPRRVQAGAARDFLLGLRFVDGHGQVLRNGGRVMKNVTGYDLARLMAGAHGTLGVVTEVALKVLPKVEAQATITVANLTESEAVAAMSTALGSPFEVTGAAHDPAEGRTMLRVEGFAASVAYRARRVADLLAPRGLVEVVEDRGASAAMWQAVRDVTRFAGAPGDVWRVSVKPSDAPGIVTRAGADGVLMDWGGGLLWLRVASGTDLRARIAPLAGHATLVRAGAETRAALGMFQPEAAAVAALSQGLRDKFDPRGVLNPGLMGAVA